MAENFHLGFSDNPESGKGEKISIKDVKPNTDITVKDAVDFVKKSYFSEVSKDAAETTGKSEETKNPKEEEIETDGNPVKRLTEEEKRKIKNETGWSEELNHIESIGQYEIYKNAGLHEAEINGRKCLVKDINMEYVDPKSDKTNRQLMSEGRAPIDSKTGEKIELHHMGQRFDSLFAELCENSEHGDGNHTTLHPSDKESWRRDLGLKREYQRQRAEYWKTRAMEE